MKAPQTEYILRRIVEQDRAARLAEFDRINRGHRIFARTEGRRK